MARCEECGRDLEAPGAHEDRSIETAPETGGGSRDSAGTGQPVCSSCGSELDETKGSEDEEIHPKAPWHFKVLVVGSVTYLGYRLYQGIGWLVHHA